MLSRNVAKSLPLNRPQNTISLTQIVFQRFKRQAASNQLNSSTQKIVNQLSVLSASRKQPRLIQLCNEDLIKHRTIMNAWKLVQRKKQQRKDHQLSLQYKSIHNAMESLKNESSELFEAANKKSKLKFTTFPIEMRVPTDYPPNKPWVYAYSPKK
ncbi:uncharacterized protein KGF55_001906 [Candida pseudojiufengensis]|uniref:uncharacterized protein n=1 Tax=Candida pseudojiufengensis TaxID=497109 RepID=UPI002225B676|nr:uncharacterized protein KGF55_001906 [Candida pseudojiufengensis]KAI5964836.1 hypothetical protein KGF55_001906 [Candida pseudojiufengensis]